MIEHRPIEGPLMDNATRIRLMVERMARVLVERDAFRDQKAAMKALVLAGYPAFLVLRKIDDARQLAMQEIVAAEMQRP